MVLTEGGGFADDTGAYDQYENNEDAEVTWSDGGDDDDDDDNVRDSSDADEYLNDPRQDPRNWQSDSGDASDVVGGGRVAPEDDEWAQMAQERYETELANLSPEQIADRVLSDSTEESDQSGMSGGFSTEVAIGLVAVAAGAAYYMGAD